MENILFLLDFYTPHKGGIENVFEHLINGLLKRGHKITLITSRFDNELKEEEKIGKLTIYRIGRGRKSFFFKGFFKACKILKNDKSINIIHSSSYTSAIPASILAKIFHKKSVLTVHEIFGKLWKHLKPRYSRRMFQLFEWLMIKFPHDIYHCVSLYTLNMLRIKSGISDKKLHLIYNGVDNDFWNINKVNKSDCEKWKDIHGLKNRFLISYYGHAGKTKGIDLLIEAIPQLLKENSDATLLFNIIPSKRSKSIIQKIETTKNNLNAKDCIQVFHGFDKAELRIFVACADIIVAPSLAEGFGSVHSEASAMGKKLITSNLAAIPEVVSGNVFLMSPPSAKGICAGVQNLKLGKISPIAKKDFNWEKMISEVENLYKD